MLTVKAEEKKEDTYKTGNLTTNQQRKVKRVIRKNEDIFIKGKYEVGRTNMVKHTIDIGEEKPIKQKARRLSVKEKEKQIHISSHRLFNKMARGKGNERSNSRKCCEIYL